MPDAHIIGKVAVKVIPETSKFRPELKAQLEKIEKRLPKLEVQAKFNSTGLKVEVLKGIRDLNRQIKGNDLFKVSIGAKITTAGMAGEVRKAIRELNAIAKTEGVKFKVDTVAGLIGAELDQASLEKVKKELEHWRDRISPMSVNIMPEMLLGASSLVNARLKILTRPREVEIVPKINNAGAAKVATALAALSGARVLYTALDGLWQRLARLDKAVPIIGTIAEAVAGLGAYGLSAASNLFTLSASLAQIGPAALVLPGIFGGMAIATGVMVAALKDFNKQIPEMKGLLSGLQDQISSNFWDKARAPIRDLIDNLFPGFSAGAQKTATELGNYFGNLATSLSTVLKPVLGSMFDDLNRSITIFAGHTNSVVSIISVLGQVGAGYLPQLASYFGDLTDRLSNFLSKAQADGSLKGWIDRGIFQIQELGRALGNLGGIFAGLAHAASIAGGSTLTSFANTLQSVEDIVKGKVFQSNLVLVLGQAHDAMAAISNQAGPAFGNFMSSLAGTVGKVFPIIGQTIGTALEAIFSALSQPAVGAGLVDMFYGIQNAVTALAPAMGPVGAALGALFSIIGALAASLGPTFGAALTVVAGIIVNLSGPLQTLIDFLGDGLLGVINSISGPLSGLGATMATAFVTALPAIKQIGTFIFNLAKAVLPVLIDGFKKIVVALAPMLAAIGQLIAVVGPVLIPVLKFLAEILIGAIVGAIQGVSLVVQGLVAIFTGVIDFFANIFTRQWGAAWQSILQILSGIWDLIKGAFLIFINVGILGLASKGLAAVKAIFTGSWEAIVGALKSLWNNLGGSFLGFVNDLKRTGTTGLQAIKNLFSMIWNDIRTFIRTVLFEIGQVFSSVLGSIKSTVSSGFNSVKSFFQGGMEGAKSIVNSAWSSVKSFFANGISDVVGKIGGLPGKIKGALGDLGGLLVGAGRAVIQGLINGIDAMIGKVTSKLQGLTQKIKDAKGPYDYDRVMLIPAGQAIIDGLIDGLESRFGDVQKLLRGLTADVAGTQFDAPTVNGADINGSTSRLAAALDLAVDSQSASNRQFIYNAAPGSSVNSEEDLFAAIDRGRTWGW